MKAIITGICLLFLVFLAYEILVFLGERQATQAELSQLETKLEKLRNENRALEADLKYYLQPVNLEKELRQRFNLRRPDEKLLILVNPSSTPSGNP